MFIAIVSISLACVIGALRTFRDRGDVSMELLTRGVLVALIGYLAASVVISENYSKLMWIMLGLGPALLAVALRSSSSELEASR